MMSESAARAKAEAWAEAWNRRDAAAVVRHYADGVEYASPFVTDLRGLRSPALRGAGPLEGFVRDVMSAHPELRIEVLYVLRGSAGLTIVHRGLGGKVFAEVMAFDDAGRVARSSVHVGAGVAAPCPAA